MALDSNASFALLLLYGVLSESIAWFWPETRLEAVHDFLILVQIRGDPEC